MSGNNSRKKKTSRAEGMTQISISLPKTLLDKVDSLAAGENRSRSNYISHLIAQLPEGQLEAMLEAAEPKKRFGV